MKIGYSGKLSINHTTLFTKVIGAWLKEHGVRTENSVWQSDDGSE